MELNKTDLKVWILALRSGKYTQTQGRLQDHNGYCCLGVACKVLIPKELLRVNPQGVLIGEMPKDQTHAPKWLLTIEREYYKKTGFGISYMNDLEGLSFPEIADRLEKTFLHDGNQ